MQIRLCAYDAHDELLAESVSEGMGMAMVDIRYRPFEEGDYLTLSCDTEGVELEVGFAQSLPASTLYYAGGVYRFDIPFGAALDPYGTAAFQNDCHWGWAAPVNPKTRFNYRCLSQNPLDLETDSPVLFPHATTNSGATNPRFLARNAIDGTWQNCHHGRWPYESFGINSRDDAWLKVDFGRPVLAEDVVLWLRADPGHDTFWTSAALELSDGTELALSFDDPAKPQEVALGTPHRIEWIRLKDMVRDDPECWWAALSQIQVWGRLV